MFDFDTKTKSKTKDVTMRDILRFSFKYWKTQKKNLGIAATMMLIAVIADVIYPVFSGHLFDALADGVGNREPYIKPAFMALAGLGLMALIHNVMRIGGVFFWNNAAVALLMKIVNDGHYKVQRFSTDWHANNFAGATVRKITRGMWGFDQFEDILYMNLGPSALVLFGITVSQIIHEPIIGLTFLAGLVVYITISILLATKYVAPVNRIWVEQDTKLGGTLADSITCNAVVKTFGSERREDERLLQETNVWAKKGLRSWNRFVSTDMIQSIVLYTLVMSLIGLSVWRWSTGHFSPGDVSYTLTSAFIVMGYVRDIGNHIRNIQKSINDMEYVVLFDQASLDIDDRPEAEPLTVKKGGVEFDDITFTYANQLAPTYKNFSVEIKPGEKVGLVGHSGSGKSTFVKLLQRLYDVDSGEIRIDGQNVSYVTQESLRQSISMVPQEPILFHRTLAENIAYGRPDATFEEVVDAAKRAHAHEFIDRLPEGYKTLVGERGIKLSGGERQRVAIARAILADKPILILDEATSSLDSISEDLIQRAIENLMEGRTTIMIAHRLSTVQNVDRILVFDQGKIVEQGPHADLIKVENGKYRALFEMQSFGLIGG